MDKYSRQLVVVPEDDANRDLANGFVGVMSPLKHRNVFIARPARGWARAAAAWSSLKLDVYVQRHVVLLVDFDGQHPVRHQEIIASIPAQFHDRVFVLGSEITPEKLKHRQTLESIGRELGQACASATSNSASSRWMQQGLAHNATELARLCTTVGALLF